MGRVHIDVDLDAGFWITDLERTVVDVHRLRHREGSDMAAHALRRYLRRPRHQLPRLIDHARSLGVERSLLADLQLLMA